MCVYVLAPVCNKRFFYFRLIILDEGKKTFFSSSFSLQLSSSSFLYFDVVYILLRYNSHKSNENISYCATVSE